MKSYPIKGVKLRQTEYWNIDALSYSKVKFIESNHFSVRSIGLSLAYFALFLGLQAQSLPELTDRMYSENPTLEAMRLEYQALQERIPQVGQLPDPELGLGLFPLPVETRLGGQQLRLSASQAFPWFGTLEAKEKLAQARAQPIVSQVEVVQLDLAYQLATAYYRLYDIAKQKAIVIEKIDLLGSLEEFVLAQVGSGEGPASDLLLVQIRLEELQQELELLDYEAVAPLATVNQLIDRPLDTQVLLPDSLPLAPLPDLNNYNGQSNDWADHPSLRILAARQEVSSAAMTLNRYDGKPSLMLGLDYIAVGERNDADPSGNGRDIIQARAGIRLPLQRGKYEAREREELARIRSIDQELEAASDQLSVELTAAVARHDRARLRHQLYDRQERLSRSARRLLTTAYANQQADFDELLREEERLIDYQLKRLEAVVESYLALAQIQKLIGYE